MQIRRFSLGLTGISTVTLLLLQSDKIILSSILPLDQFGYYSIAATVAAALSTVVGTFFFSLYPRYSGLVATGATSDLTKLYHQSNQVLAVFLAAVSVPLALYAYDVLLLWTHDHTLAANSAPILSILVMGTALQGLAHLPYALQLAHGWTRLAFRINLVSVFILVPAIWWLAHSYGGIGTAFALLALNVSDLLIAIPLMHRRLLPGQGSIWLWRDISPPVGLALAVGVAAKTLIPSIPEGPSGFVLLAAIGITVFGASSLGAESIRTYLKDKIRHLVT